MGRGTNSGLTSVGGILALLDEDSYELKHVALERLNEQVNQFWAEIAASITKM